MQEENQEPAPEYMDLMVGGKLRKVRVVNTEIQWEGKQEIVTIKRLSYGERATFTERFIKVTIQEDQSSTNIDMHAMQIQTLLMTIIKAPFPVTEDYLDYELDGVLGEDLYKIADNLNKINPNKKKNSNLHLNTEVKIQK